MNDNIKKRNEKGTNHEKELEDIITNLKSYQITLNNKIAELEKQLKEKTAEFISAR